MLKFDQDLESEPLEFCINNEFKKCVAKTRLQFFCSCGSATPELQSTKILLTIEYTDLLNNKIQFTYNIYEYKVN